MGDEVGPLTAALLAVKAWQDGRRVDADSPLPAFHETFRQSLKELRWSRRCFADQISRDERMVRRWVENGTLPETYAAWLDVRAEHARKTPSPLLARRQGNRKTPRPDAGMG